MRHLPVLVAFALMPLAPSVQAQSPRGYDDEPAEYRDRKDQQEAYRRGYERGYDRGFQRGLEEGRRAMPAQNVAPPVVVAPAPAPVLGPIKVSGAFYGSGKKNCDATRYVGRHANGNRTYSFKVSNDMCGDPDRGQRKTLEVTYWCGQVSRTASAREHQDIYLNCY